MKLLENYKEISPPVKASFWFLLCSFLQKGIAMLTTPIFTRIMSEEAYGQFTVYNSWYNIFFAIVSLNFAAGVFTRGLVKNDTDQDAFSSSFILIHFLMTCLESLLNCRYFFNPAKPF